MAVAMLGGSIRGGRAMGATDSIGEPGGRLWLERRTRHPHGHRRHDSALAIDWTKSITDTPSAAASSTCPSDSRDLSRHGSGDETDPGMRASVRLGGARPNRLHRLRVRAPGADHGWKTSTAGASRATPPATLSSNAPRSTSRAPTNSAVAQVDSRGSVPAGVGMASITAALCAAVGCDPGLHAAPSRIEVTPAQVSAPYGGTLLCDAAPYDVNDRPPGAVVTWRVMVAGGVTDSTTLRISSTGALSPRTLGYYVVPRLRFSIPAPTIDSSANSPARLPSQVVPDYTVKPLVSTANTLPAFRLRGKRGTITANASGPGRLLRVSRRGSMTWRSAAPGLSALATASIPVSPPPRCSTISTTSPSTAGNVLAQSWSLRDGQAVSRSRQLVGVRRARPRIASPPTRFSMSPTCP